jgi:8-oxo-dGTP diphosphatase
MGQQDQGIYTGRPRYQAIPRVLIFLRNGLDVLLLKGAPTKRIWANLYNGVGGHVEQGEDILSAARREVQEETGLDVPDLKLRAVVNIDGGDSTTGILMFVFTGWSETREITASHEGALHWVAAEALADLPLVEDLSWLLPRLLALPETAGPLFLHYGYDQTDHLVIRQAN